MIIIIIIGSARTIEISRKRNQTGNDIRTKWKTLPAPLESPLFFVVSTSVRNRLRFSNRIRFFFFYRGDIEHGVARIRSELSKFESRNYASESRRNCRWKKKKQILWWFAKAVRVSADGNTKLLCTEKCMRFVKKNITGDREVKEIAYFQICLLSTS